MEQKTEGRMGWERSREVEAEKTTIAARAKVESKVWLTLLKYAIVFGLLFWAATWLAGNPFEFTRRIPSAFVKAKGWVGTNNWQIVWWVVLICAFFEYMDSSAGMGYGTALTPLMLVAGFDPKQIVPCVMITEMVTGITAGLIHGEFENVEWRFKPMNETTRMVVAVSLIGMASVAISITAVYKVFALHKFWIKLYVTILLIVMGACSLGSARAFKTYRPKLMYIFAGVAGLNKGIGGGGYGPVVTVGGLLAGVPVKAMVAVTSFAEGFTCVFAVITWLFMLTQDVVIDYMLLPTFVLGTVLAAVAAPYTTRVLPEKFWRWTVPIYCCLLAAYSFYKIWPDIAKRLF